MWIKVLLLLLVVTVQAKPETLPDPITRVTQTLNGLFHYYWQLDPLSKGIGFFFACGQIGGWGEPAKWTECSCNNPYSCSDCYRWWDAIALESIASFGISTSSKRNITIADIFFAHSPYNANWYGCTYIDDFLWYGITYLNVYEWSKDPKWLQRSIALHDWGWKNGWDDQCGGVWWRNCKGNYYKDSVTILELLHFASKLSFMLPNQSKYLTGAEKIWAWFFSFDDGRGLMSNKYLVSTGAVPEQCCNSSSSNPFSRCVNSNISGTSYNQGLLMSSAAYLYRRTGNKTYLNVGMRALEAILTNYTTKEGILIDEPRSYQTYKIGQCWGGSSDPGGDYYSFQGVFMLHLSYFTELLAENGSLSAETMSKIQTFVEKTSDAAWLRSAVWSPFQTTDACNTNPTHPNVNYPKFHWWWGNKNVTQQVMPPDPSHFFPKTQLRCHSIGNHTQLWQGMTNDESDCKQKCMKNKNCSKYLYQSDQSTVQGLDCWIWSYNRSDHICNGSDSNFNVGIKRPVGATCKNHCDSKEPLKLDHDGVCYCDSNCTKHLDCCLDYADFCLPDNFSTCEGLCNVTEPRAIKGGGYCWCMAGCFEWFTDNNSYGSCCPDYNIQCLNVTIPTCLDARTQGNALNLFLAHLKISKAKNIN